MSPDFGAESTRLRLGILKRGGYITVDSGGAVELTETGRAVAEEIYDRHQTLTAGLMKLGVDEETASEDACRMEHYISRKSFSAIKKYLSEKLPD